MVRTIPPGQSDQYYFDCVGRSIDKYSSYDNFILAGDFNAEEWEPCLKSSFMFEYDIYCLVKDKTCFKNPDNPSCIDLFITNNKYSFRNTTTVCTGASDCHKMVVTVLKTTFEKNKPKELLDRDYKHFDNQKFRNELNSSLKGDINS